MSEGGSRYARPRVSEADDRNWVDADDSGDYLGEGEGEGERESTEATQVASPAAARRQRHAPNLATSATNTAASATSTTADSFAAATSAEALLVEEVARTRVFAQLAFVLAILVLGGLPMVGGDPTVRVILMAALGVCALQCVWVVFAFRDASRYRATTVTLLAAWATATVMVGILFWGTFSVAPALVVLGIYFFGRSQSRAGALFIYIFIAVAQATLATLILSEAITDPGLFPVGDEPFHVKLITQLLVQVVFVFAFVLSRSTRASTVKAIDQLQQAMRQVSQREAQLLEVRQDLDRALDVGGPGRYSEQVFGAYKLGIVIGRGGMAEVYEGHHTETGDIVAVKLLHPTVAESADSVTRFLREARAASALSSPHSVRILASSAGEQPPHYLVMERLHGHDLSYYLRKRRRLAPKRLCELVAHIGSVIDLAAQSGIVHRDLKPQNLFFAVQPDGSKVWKLLDYGVSKLGDDADALTRGHAVGTPSYMSPEQARSKPVDTRADIYSLAALAYRCLTGQPPFSGRDVPALLYRVVYEMPPRPSSLAKLPRQFDDVLAIGLAKRPENRFASAAELSEALAAAARGEGDDWLERRAEALLVDLPWGKH